MFLATGEGICLRANEQTERLMGMPGHEILGTGWLGALHPDDRDRVMEEWAAATAAGGTFRSEFRILRKADGAVTSVISDANVVPRADGEPPVWIGALTDISHLVRRERMLIEQDEALMTAADQASELQVLLAVEPDGELVITFANQQFLAMARRWRPGLTAGDLVGRTRDEVARLIGFPEENTDGERPYYEEAIRTRKRVSFAASVRAGHRIFHQETVLSPVVNRNGDLTHVLWSSRDVTARRQAEEARRIGDLAFNHSSDMQVLLKVGPGRELRVVRWNQRHQEAARSLAPGGEVPDGAGKVREEWLAEVGFDPATIEAETAQYWQAIDTKAPVRFEWTVATPAGPLTLETVISPVLDEAGECTQVLWTGRDVTGRKELEDARRIGDLAFEQSSDMLALLRIERDGGLRNIRTNQRYRDVLKRLQPDLELPAVDGMLREDWLAAAGLSLEVAEAEMERYREAIETRKPVSFEWTVETPAGSGTVETVITPVLDGAGECTHVIWSGRSATARKLAEDELRASRETMNEAQAIAHVGSWTLDLVTGHLGWSDEIYRIFEIDPEKFAASYEAFLNAIHPDDRDLVDQAYTGSVELKQSYAIQHRLLMPDGRIKHVLERGTTQYREDGTPLRSVGTVQDVTDRVEAERRLEGSEALFRATFEQSSIGMLVAGPGGEIELVNGRFAEITGLTVEEICSGTLADLRVLAASPTEGSLFREVFAGHASSYSEERRLIRRDGMERWVALTISAIREGEELARVLVVVEDVTERRIAEERLRRTEELARVGGWELNLQTGVLFVSPSARRVVGLDPADAVGTTVDDMFVHIHPDDAERTRAELASPLQTGTSAIAECRVAGPGGGVRVVQVGAEVERDAAGGARLLRGYVQDISDRVLAEQEARESDLRLKVMLDQVPAILWTTDAELRFTYVAGKPFVERGVDIEGMLGRHLLDVWGDSDRNRTAVEYHRQALAGETVTYTATRGERTFRTSLVPLRGGPGEVGGVLAVSFNVTDEVKAAEALQRSEAALLRAEALAKMGSWEWDFASGIVKWSPEAYRQFGIRPLETGAPTIELVRSMVHPQDLHLMDAALARISEQGEMASAEYRINARDGEVRHLRSESELILDDGGRLTGVFGYMQDITVQKAIEQELLRKDQAIASSILGIIFADFDANLTFANRSFLEMWGFDDEAEVVGRSSLEFWEDPQLARKALEAVVNEGGEVGELTARRKDGSTFDTQFVASVIVGPGGERVGLMGQFLDISYRRQAERMLAESEELFRATFEQGAVGIAITELDGTMRRVNSRFCEILGYAVGELDGTHFSTITHPDDLDLDAVQGRALLTGKIPTYRMEKRYLRRDGSIVWVDLSVSGIRRDGRIVQLVGAIEDISERKAALDALRRSEASLLRTQQMAKVGTWEHSLVTGGTRWSPEIYRQYGVSRQDFEVPRFRDDVNTYVHPDDRERVSAHARQALRSGSLTPIEYRLVGVDGAVRDILREGELIYDADGSVIGSRGFAQDITDRKASEQQLAESEELFRTTFEQAAVGMVLFVPREPFRKFNRKFAELTGYTDEELHQTRITALWPSDTAQQDDPRSEEVLRGALDTYTVDREFLRKSGERRCGRFTVSMRRQVGAPNELMLVLEDVTDRVKGEEALRRSEAALAEAERMAGIGSWETDLRTGAMQWSPEMFRRFGIAPSDGPPLTSRRARELTSDRVHPDEREAQDAVWDRFLQTGQDVAEFEYHFRVPSGDYRLVRAVTEVERDAEGRPVRLRGLQQDVTEQRATEKRIADQLQEKEVLLREIHHRVKNNLQVVSSLLFLQQQRSESEEVLEVLRESSNRVAAMALVHEKLYSSEDLAVVEFRDYVRELARSLFVSFGVDTERIGLSVEGAGFVLPLDQAIPVALIVNEIVSNALKHAFPGVRRGSVSIRLIAAENGHVIEIGDDGIGAPPEQVQTTATLGTRLIRRLAAQMGATIEQTGPGTVYRLTLPKESGK